jgi:hypothetical protein
MLRFSLLVISSSWFVPAYTVRADLVSWDPGRIGGIEGETDHAILSSRLQFDDPCWFAVKNRAIMVVIRAESTELNYGTGGDDGVIIAMLRFSPPVISSSSFVPAYTVRAGLVSRNPGRIGGD